MGPDVFLDDYDSECVLQMSSSQCTPSDTDVPLLQLYTFFLLMFQTLFRLSDTAINTLMTFFAMFFKTLSQRFQAFPQSFISNVPFNIRAARKLGENGSIHLEFEKFVCCPNCNSLYAWDECIIKQHNGQIESKCCSFVRFSNHPRLQHRKVCNTMLMKKVKTSNATIVLYPRRIYCYKSIVDSLQEMLLRPDFLKKCEQWRSSHCNEPNVYNDIYDGKIWRDFQYSDGKPFLALPYNFAFQINVDWFNPFSHTQHSKGVIYMSVMNLPRRDRFLQENILLVGVIPGPTEPSLHINTFLKPLVEELKSLWIGRTLKNAEGNIVFVRAALLCCGCDIPAARKLCGFVGHRATKGCSKCLASFPTQSFGEKADYSNFNRDEWELRTNEAHRILASKYYNCNTQVDQHKIERESGVRYTVLLELPYFDASRMCTIDPMHNLLLGTSKNVIETWKVNSVIDSKMYDTIQQRVDSFVCPPDMGRVPSKISSGFSGFTAEQWKNWTLFFSLFALKNIIPWQHYNCWHLFVKACFLICQRSITTTQVNEADDLLMAFCRKFVDLYGAESSTINMHLHGHLADCIRDYGPVYSFWCFAFERMNGILGSYHTNNHHISIQFTRRFLDSKIYAPFNWPPEYVAEYFPLLNRFRYQQGSLQQETVETQIVSGVDLSIKPLPPLQEYALHLYEQQLLCTIFNTFLARNTFQVLVLCNRAKALLFNEIVIGARESRHAHSSVVLAKNSCEEVALAEILFFIQCTAHLNENNKNTQLWVAAVSWFMDHPCKHWFGNPVQVWSSASYPDVSFIPVTNIVSRVVYSKVLYTFGQVIGSDSVYVVVPLVSSLLQQ